MLGAGGGASCSASSSGGCCAPGRAPATYAGICKKKIVPSPLPLGPGLCGQHGHGCRRRLNPWGDHALACTRSGLLARRAKLVEQAWLAVCREAVEAEGHVVPPAVAVAHVGARSPDVGPPTPRPSGARRIAAGPRVAMPRWSAPSPERTPLTHERSILQASPCAWPRAASAQPTRSCSAGAATASSSLGPGFPCATYPPPLPGHAGGGACCRLQCSTPLAARPWERWRSLSELARAASRCAERGTRASRWAARLRHMHSCLLRWEKNLVPSPSTFMMAPSFFVRCIF